MTSDAASKQFIEFIYLFSLRSLPLLINADHENSCLQYLSLFDVLIDDVHKMNDDH